MPDATPKAIASLIFSISRGLRERGQGNDPFSQIRLEALQFVERQQRQKGPTMKEIAEYFSIKPPTATTLVNSLVAEGLFTRRADNGDRRIVRILISLKGKAALKEGHRRKLKEIERKFAPLNTSEQKELVRMLEKIAQHYKV